MSGPSRPSNSRAPSSMAGGGWRNAAFSKLAKVKDYVVSHEVSKSAYTAVSNRVVAYRTGVDPTTGEKRQTWEEWAREKRQRRREEQKGVEKIELFPGWAVKRYPNNTAWVKDNDVQQFTIDVFVSGFASSLRTPEQATRSQRAFMKIARGFSALPRLPPPPKNILGGSGSATPLTQSPNSSTDELTEELARMGIVLPPRPDEIDEEAEIRMLKARSQPKVEKTRDSRIVDYGAGNSQPSFSVSAAQPSLSSSRPKPPPLPSRSPTITTQSPSPNTSPAKKERSNTASSISSMLSVDSTRSNTDVASMHPEMDIGILRQLHANLDARLQPFWSSKLENRKVRIFLYAQPPDTPEQTKATEITSLASAQVKTNSQGYFSQKFTIPFEQLCTNDQALHIAYGNGAEEHSLYVRAELLPTLYAHGSSGSGAEVSTDIEIEHPDTRNLTSSVRVQTELKLSTARVRVISDVDDTVKISEVLMGLRAIFHNVFVRHLDELVVPGMPQFYAKLADRGAKFHYVSNSPFELLSVLNDFFGVSDLPKGSVKLKSYGGRNLFQGLWGESAGERKRGNVVDVLDSFPESKFILVGDTGEQDLELYSALAVERPDQIIALFLRDVTPATPPPTAPSTPNLGPVDDHTMKKKGSVSSLRSIQSITGGKMPKEELPKLHIPQASQDSTSSGLARSGLRSVTNPTQSSSPPTPYKVYTPATARARGSSGSYFDSRTPVATRTDLPPVPGQFMPANLNFGVDPASALVAAAATAGTGHNAEEADTTRAGILAKKEALRSRLKAAKEQVPPGIVLRVFKEPWECEDEAMQVIDRVEKSAINS